ncbi:MAG TPA: amino acid permease [Chitinophagales bacterium]|nr:amino acid permease [Chitinophagales bacterium]
MANLFRKKSIQSILKETEAYPDMMHEAGITLDEQAQMLNKSLTTFDLTALGIAAIIGAGIFSTIGNACFDGGPAVVFLFIGIAIACGFSALCYAEFASRIPIAGSAYTYSYAVFGELIAWIIGWDLLLEYAIGNITVAISWSGNFAAFLHQCGIDLPKYLVTSFFEAKKFMPDLYASAPKILGIPFIINIPAFMINLFITALVYVGIKESKNFANGMVIFKIAVIIVIIIVGAFYVTPANWSPFVPNGFGGVLKGVSAVFFAYIGFDAISTTAEECKNPQRDLPKGMFNSLILSTILYVAVALVLTGMVHYTQLKNEAFLANAFVQKGINWMGGIIAFSALIATASVMLVFQIGQPRIWMSMSRDGLLPKKFAEIHPKFKTPSFSTIITGLIVGIPSLFLDSSLVTDMCSIGTLFAFILVCGGIIILEQKEKKQVKLSAKTGTLDEDLLSESAAPMTPKFKVPYINGKWLIAGLTLAVLAIIFTNAAFLHSIFPVEAGFDVWKHQIPLWLFLLVLIYTAYKTFMENWSLIPVLGFLSCGYLVSTLGIANWLRFFIWMAIGLICYFIYGVNHSKLRNQ